MEARFDASSRTEVLERLFREPAPRRWTAKLEGAAAGIAKTVVVVMLEGRLADAVAGPRRGLDALTVLALAEGGALVGEAIAPPPGDPARLPDAVGLYRQAVANAAEVARRIAPLGGLGAKPVSDVDRLVAELSQIPDAANAVLRLVDGRSTTAAVLGRSPHDLTLTARILERLCASEVVIPPATVLPEPIDESGEVVVPSPDEMEGDAVNADVRQWLEDEEPPAQLLSPDAFQTAFGVAPGPGTRAPLEAPARVRASVPLTTKRPVKRDEDEDFFRAAGVRKTSMSTWIVLALAGVALGMAGSLFLGGGRPARRPDSGVAVVMPRDASTSSVTTASTTETASTAIELVDGRPPIAGPDAPEDVKHAERLLNAGRYSDARALLDQLRKTRANDATVWILSGQVEVDVGRLNEANGLADRALELDPKSYRAWVLKGSVLQFLGRFTPARSAYEQAIALDPNHPMTPEIQSVLEQMNNLNR